MLAEDSSHTNDHIKSSVQPVSIRYQKAILYSLAACTGVALFLSFNTFISTRHLLQELGVDFNKHISKYIKDHPQEIMDALNAHAADEQAKKDAANDLLTETHKSEILKSNGLPTLGNPTGKITITYFYDDNCPFCKAMAPILDDVMAKNPDIKIIHRAIPILMPSSEYAARFDLAVWSKWPQKYKKFHDALLPFHEGQMTEANVNQVANEVLGATDGAEALKMVTNSPSAETIKGRVQDNLKLMAKIHIDGTPFIYVENGSNFRGVTTEENLQASIDKARARMN